MRIAGLEKSSFVDYPGKMAAVIFTPGCNMDCFYCHNRQLLAPGEDDNLHDPQAVLEFLRSRRFLLDGVVISGGEPTIQGDLEDFIRQVKNIGLLVKLDTNGTRPWVLRSLIEKKLVDFVAMDLKAPVEAEAYKKIAGLAVDINAINESIDMLLDGEVDYEFRTTFAPTLKTIDIAKIAARIHRAKSYVLQQYRKPGLGVDMFGLVDSPEPHSEKYVCQTAMLAQKFIPNCTTRGLSLPLKPTASPVVANVENSAMSTVSTEGTPS